MSIRREEARVSLPVSEELRRIPMSFDEYLAYDPGEGFRAEWVDGIAIVSPPATRPHGSIMMKLGALFLAHLPGTDVSAAPGVRTAPTKYREPDVAVFETAEDVVFSEQAPLIAVEVLSPSTRAEDTLRKSVEYQRAGIGQYWIVDRDNRVLTVLENRGEEWSLVVELTDKHPTGEVVVSGHGTIPLDLATLLGG